MYRFESSPPEYKLNIDLRIPPQNFISQYQLHSQDIQNRVQKGIELAIKDVFEDEEKITNLVRESARKQILDLIQKDLIDYSTKSKVREIFQNKISENIENLLEQVFNQFNNQIK